MKTEDDLLALDRLSVMLTSMLPMGDELEYEMPVIWAVIDAARR